MLPVLFEIIDATALSQEIACRKQCPPLPLLSAILKETAETPAATVTPSNYSGQASRRPQAPPRSHTVICAMVC
jgi:hypothetical protein